MKVNIHSISAYVHNHISNILRKYNIKSVLDMGGTGKLKQFFIGKIQNANIKQGFDATNLDIESKSFDAVVSIATLEHVINQQKFLDEALRITRKIVIHWFPIGEDAKKTEKFKRSLGYRHPCKLPDRGMLDEISKKCFKYMTYPFMTISEHLLALANMSERMNTKQLYNFIDNNIGNYGCMFIGELDEG